MSFTTKDMSRANVVRRFIVMGLICVLAHLMFVPHMGPASGLINLALVFSGCVAFSFGGRPAVLVGFLSGLFFDLTTTGPIGLMALLLSISSWVLSLVSSERFAQVGHPALKQFLLADGAVNLVYHASLLLSSGPTRLVALLFVRVLPSVFLTFLVFLIARILLMKDGSVRGLSGKLPRDGSSKHFAAQSGSETL